MRPQTLLTLEQVAEQLAVKPRFVYRLVHERRITFIKVGERALRFEQSAVDEYIEARRHDRRRADIAPLKLHTRKRAASA